MNRVSLAHGGAFDDHRTAEAPAEYQRPPEHRSSPVTAKPAEAPIVSLRRLGKVYHRSPPWLRFLVRSNIKHSIVALADVDLDVYPGDICAVVGPNGAGKTTLFRILVGLTTPSSGRATVMGLDASSQSVAVRRLIGWMPAEDRSLFMRHTCAENLYLHGRLHGIRPRELKRRISAILEEVGLGGRREASVFSLSSGMRARLQLARALLHRPHLLILDEPTAAVDPVGAHALLTLILEVVSHYRLAALISSHRLEEIEALHSHVTLLDKGRIRYKGNLDDFRQQWDRPQIEIEFATEHSAQRAMDLLAAHASVARGKVTSLLCTPGLGVTTGAMLRVLTPIMNDIEHIRERPIPLRDLLMEVYRPDPVLAGESQ